MKRNLSKEEVLKIKKDYKFLKIGDRIKFNYFGAIKEGIIETVGKYGYWINSGLYNGSVRCSFGQEI